MNYWVYINQNPSLEPADIVVLDDAQLAETALASLFSVRIGRHEQPGCRTAGHARRLAPPQPRHRRR